MAPARTNSAGLATRLLAGQAIVLVAGALTVGLVAAMIGPPIFHQHLVESGHQQNSPELVHIETAYREASLISVGVGLLISLLAAGAVTWFLTRRLRRPLEQVTTAAMELTRGHYSTRVPTSASGTELETFATAFNTMASRLEGIEDTRRRMLSDLAHELRTPIATLSAYHEGLHDGMAALGPESREALEEQTRRLARLADDIDEARQPRRADSRSTSAHTTSGIFSGRPTRACLTPLPPRGSTSSSSHQPPQGSMSTSIETASDRSSPISSPVHSATPPPGGTVILAANRQGEEAAISVIDDGDGMTPEQLEHAFERFYRGDAARTRDRTGSGIGLTISKALIDAHHGSISANSDGQGEGTRLILTLPLPGR
ncbi:sensor histidine kinase [Calidifontibacter indicus]|uniref:histidine kinase n=1 Tax=Calidifontibacter indicus TaxID=419650 RepID=A0A3D9UN30_9MICO|nr:signal transduction histidine kinase [Calidifontibacter indicus]